jgi:FlaA1/EpsC-like NDP-sugar epimerase
MENFSNFLNKRLIAFLHDAFMVPIAWCTAIWLRFNLGDIPTDILTKSKTILPMLCLIQLYFYWSFGLYRGVWRFASLPDLLRILRAVTVSVLAMILILFLTSELVFVPRSIFPLYWVLLVVLLGGSRFCYRMLKDGGSQSGKRVLIVGAGKAGEGIVRDMLRNSNKNYQAVAFVDDMASKQGREVHGVRVVGTMEDIPSVTQRFQIDLIIIAMPSASSSLMRRIVSLCENSSVPFRTLPGLNDLTQGNVRIDSLREVLLEDLLGRTPVALDWTNIRKGIEGKTVLVSGGGGSIGSELCRQIASLHPKKLVVIEQNEFNLYSLDLELTKKFPNLNFVGYLADIGDTIAVHKMFQQNSIDIVFHAAAYKHVPLLENQVRIAVKNNILGTKTLAYEAVSSGVKKFILISSDKAVNPTNVMGATKRSAESVCQAYNSHSETQFITVRFGNVLGSAGSVVPLFRKQIKEGGPVTVTHPEITRFFMTIPEATQLILQATIIGSGGEIFVLDMGEPVKIRYLAEQMILLSGLKPGKDIEIRYTGLRPGEKLYEELFYESEKLVTTTHPKIMQAIYYQMDTHKLKQLFENLELACRNNQEDTIQKLLLEITPEYRSSKMAESILIEKTFDYRDSDEVVLATLS